MPLKVSARYWRAPSPSDRFSSYRAVRSKSVTLPRPLVFLTLGFGYHVEHHMFPAMSTRHAPLVRDRILAHWPERYQSMPLTSALAALHRTARVYRDQTTLTDPRSGAVWPTLLPR